MTREEVHGATIPLANCPTARDRASALQLVQVAAQKDAPVQMGDKAQPRAVSRRLRNHTPAAPLLGAKLLPLLQMTPQLFRVYPRV